MRLKTPCRAWLLRATLAYLAINSFDFCQSSAQLHDKRTLKTRTSSQRHASTGAQNRPVIQDETRVIGRQSGSSSRRVKRLATNSDHQDTETSDLSFSYRLHADSNQVARPSQSIPAANPSFEAAFQGECSRNHSANNPCDHICLDLHDGTYECACYYGFALAVDGYSCTQLSNSSEWRGAPTTPAPANGAEYRNKTTSAESDGIIHSHASHQTGAHASGASFGGAGDELSIPPTLGQQLPSAAALKTDRADRFAVVDLAHSDDAAVGPPWRVEPPSSSASANNNNHSHSWSNLSRTGRERATPCAPAGPCQASAASRKLADTGRWSGRFKLQRAASSGLVFAGDDSNADQDADGEPLEGESNEAPATTSAAPRFYRHHGAAGRTGSGRYRGQSPQQTGVGLEFRQRLVEGIGGVGVLSSDGPDDTNTDDDDGDDDSDDGDDDEDEEEDDDENVNSVGGNYGDDDDNETSRPSSGTKLRAHSQAPQARRRALPVAQAARGGLEFSLPRAEFGALRRQSEAANTQTRFDDENENDDADDNARGSRNNDESTDVNDDDGEREDGRIGLGGNWILRSALRPSKRARHDDDAELAPDGPPGPSDNLMSGRAGSAGNHLGRHPAAAVMTGQRLIRPETSAASHKADDKNGHRTRRRRRRRLRGENGSINRQRLTATTTAATTAADADEQDGSPASDASQSRADGAGGEFRRRKTSELELASGDEDDDHEGEDGDDGLSRLTTAPRQHRPDHDLDLLESLVHKTMDDSFQRQQRQLEAPNTSPNDERTAQRA